MNNKIYSVLAEKLNAFPIGAPYSEELVEILRALFNEEEAQIASKLPLVPTDLKSIVQDTGFTSEWLLPRLDTMSQKGLVYSSTKQGRPHFSLLPFVPGIVELQYMGPEGRPINRATRHKLALLFDRYYHKQWKNSKLKFRKGEQFARVIPVERNIENLMGIEPYERVSAYIHDNVFMAIGDCYCRKEMGLIGKSCGAPLDVCMIFGPFARFCVEKGFARRADKPMMTEALDKAEEAGLVHLSDNIQEKVNFICNCCPCCCGILGVLTRLKVPNSIAVSNYLSSIDQESCTGCEECIDRCPVSAISVKGDTVSVDEYNCIGCGLCVSSCPAGAIRMKQKEELFHPHKSLLELHSKILRSREGL